VWEIATQPLKVPEHLGVDHGSSAAGRLPGSAPNAARDVGQSRG
jgi:hypothetical protein